MNNKITNNWLILGTNAVGHDSSIVYFDIVTEEIFALDNERATRMKHDGTSIKDCLFEFMRWKEESTNGRYLELNEAYNNEETFTFSYLLNKKLLNEIRRVFALRYIKDIASVSNLPIQGRMRKYLIKLPHSWKLVLLTPISRFLEIVNYANIKPSNNHTPIIKRLKHYIRFDIRKTGYKSLNINFYDHHLCHCIAAYYFSPFDSCLSISLDFSGDGYFSKVYKCEDGSMVSVAASPIIRAKDFYLSIGMIYSTVTQFLGFIPNSDEGKVEALAAYGSKNNELYHALMESTNIKDDLGINIDKNAWEYIQPNYLKNIEKKHGKECVAAAVQGYLEDFMTMYLNRIMDSTGEYNVCFSGGTFANVKLNMSILEKSRIKNQYVFPAMPDSGTAVGALILRLKELGLISLNTFKHTRYQMPYWGSQTTEKELREAIAKFNDLLYVKDLGDDWPEAIATIVCQGNIGAIFHGRCEYGPRALGNRSILADSRRADSRERINTVIKGRPLFQPFCPSILEEDRLELFYRSYPNKHMTCAFRMKEYYVKEFPSAVHIDGTCRPQFVEKQDNPNFYRLLKKVKDIIGKGILINTSFNKHGRTIVLKPEDAIIDFIDSRMDFICIEGKFITKNQKIRIKA